MTHPNAEIQAGLLIHGKYRLERELGAGGMGMLWVAEDLALGRTVAIKFPAKHHLNNEEALARFARESRYVGKIRSPRVVQVFDQGVAENGIPYIAMELLEGHDLATHLAQSAPCPLAQTGEIVAQVCRALQHAHQLGLVHRDIKPHNIFLTPEAGGEFFVKLLDFGIAKEVGAEVTSLTRTGMSMGSLQYMSPEQLTDAKAVDARSDVWGLGVVIYELLTGSLPFDAPSAPEFLCRITTGTFMPASELRVDLPKSVDGFFSRALAPDLGRRFTTIDELGRAFARVVAAAPASLQERKTATREPADAAKQSTDIKPAPHAGTKLSSALLGASAMAVVMLVSAAVWPHRSNQERVAEKPTHDARAAVAERVPSEPVPELPKGVVPETPTPSQPVSAVPTPAPEQVAPARPKKKLDSEVTAKSARKSASPVGMRPPSEELRSKLVAAINHADAIEILAFRRMDPSGLSSAYTGEALQRETVSMKGLVDQGAYRVSQLRQRQIQSILVSADGTKAEVRMNELWETWFYNKATNTCRGHLLPQGADQTVFLTLRAGAWLVSTLTFHNAPRPNVLACR